jgi:hypothetical protein
LLAICRPALLDPCSCGAKLTQSVQLPLGAIGPMHALDVIRNSCGSVPVKVRPVTSSGLVPLLVIVTVFGPLIVLCACEGKVSDWVACTAGAE